METERKKRLLEELKKIMLTVTEHVEISQELRLTSAFTTLQDPEEKGSVLYEMEYIEMLPGTTQLELDLTMDIHFKDDTVIPQLEQAIMNLNMFIPMGALGISYRSKQLFCRYTIYIDETQQDSQLALYIYHICELLGGVIGSIFKPFKAIAAGEMTYQEAVDKQRMIRQ